MHPLRSLCFSALAIIEYFALASASLTEHPINECYDHEFLTYNASATVNFPPLSQNITNSSLATWKLGTAIKELRGSNASVVKQKWWLEGDSNLSANASALPIDGCIVLLQASPNNTFLSKGVDNTTSQNGCSKVFTPECQNAMISWVTHNITTLADKELNDHWTVCPRIAHLLNKPPKECGAAYRLDTVPLHPLGNPEFIAPAENGCDSGDFNIFEGSAIRNSFLELPTDPFPLKEQTKYDEVVEMTNPFLLISWPRDRRQGWSADAQIACLTASENIVRGSRVPGSTPSKEQSPDKSVASTAVQEESLFALWMMLLVLSVML